MPRYTAILFDLDGTLIDTNELIITSFLHTLQTHIPGQFTREDILPIMGQPLLEQMQKWDVNQAEEMVKTYQQFNETKHDELVREFPQVLEVLEELYHAGIQMGVVSNKRRKVVEMGLCVFGIDRFMKKIVCAGEGLPAKPAPDMLIAALKNLQAKPGEALMVGDTRFDLIAGKKAGVDQVGVGWSLHPSQLKEHHPTYFIEEMRELLTIVGLGEEKV